MTVAAIAKVAVAGKQSCVDRLRAIDLYLLGVVMNEQYDAIAATLPHSMEIPNLENEPSLEYAVQYIENIDFSLIFNKLCSGDPLLCRRWSPIEAEIGIQYYKNFLYINKKYLHKHPVLPPLLEVDEIWHHHILDTRSYMKDCQNIFGYYFHHYPYFGARGNDDKKNLGKAFELVQELYKEEFGYYMTQLWEA
ncbi:MULTISPECIES: glycine-rich domain-containing protein [Pseudomonas syringae group]|nr:hypothetical protein [Pseudomonas savastanoi]EFW82819.1 hypothetical protein PsgRace4_27880 [Pseudomonas savastanoi pv. glycinea str. race 4]EGH16850.1 hypothetical protein Pgy4_27820 [Pseudomonas savastanoi pv. glycinea str. race 4]